MLKPPCFLYKLRIASQMKHWTHPFNNILCYCYNHILSDYILLHCIVMRYLKL